MACGARPGADAPAGTCPKAARRWYTAAGRVPAVADAARVTSGQARVLDADIEACFDRIDHTALMGRLRARVRRTARPKQLSAAHSLRRYV